MDKRGISCTACRPLCRPEALENRDGHDAFHDYSFPHGITLPPLPSADRLDGFGESLAVG